MMAPHLFSTGFGLLMVAATAVQADGPVFVAVALAVCAVVIGIGFRPAATLAVVFAVSAIALSAPSPVLSVLAGLCAAAYLMLRYAAGPAVSTVTTPTAVGALCFSSVGLIATAIPVELPWLPLVAPATVLAIYVLVTQPFTVRGFPQG
jgi:hypothetical protein